MTGRLHPSVAKTSSKQWGMPLHPGTIPPELRALGRRWLPWTGRPRAGKSDRWDKIPAGGGSTKRHADWQNFDTALHTLEHSPEQYSGIGLLLTDLEGWTVVDLDHCVRWDDWGMQVKPWAAKLVALLDSYTELSPSSTGLRVFLRGEHEGEFVDNARGIEVYIGASLRFVTVTGRALPGHTVVRSLTVGASKALALMGEGHMTSQAPQEPSEEISELAEMPDITTLRISPWARTGLAEGFQETDRSKALARATGELVRAGLSDSEIITILLNSPGALAVAEDHWSPAKAKQYLQRHHLEKKRAQSPGTLDPGASYAPNLEEEREPGARDRPRFGDLSEEGLEVPESQKRRKPKEPKEKPGGLRLSYLGHNPDELPTDLPPRRWVAQGVAMRNMLTTVIGRGGVAKSTWALHLAVSVAAGVDILGYGVAEQTRVMLVNNEDDSTEIKRRLWAVCLQHGLDMNEVMDNLTIYAGYKKRLRIADCNEQGDVYRTDMARDFANDVKDLGCGMVIMDPLITLHSCDENSNRQMQDFADHLKSMAAYTDAAVVLVHHTRKGDQDAGNADLSRGATAVTDASRIVLTVTRASPVVARELGIEDSVRKYVQVAPGKENYSLSAEQGHWYELEGVELGQGDSVGTLKPWDVQEAREAAQNPEDEEDWIAQGVEAMRRDTERVDDLTERLAGLWHTTNSVVRRRFIAQIDANGMRHEVELEDGSTWEVWRTREGGRGPEMMHRSRLTGPDEWLN